MESKKKKKRGSEEPMSRTGRRNGLKDRGRGRVSWDKVGEWHRHTDQM